MKSSVYDKPNQSMNSIREEAAQWVLSLDEADSVQYEVLMRECKAWQAEHPQHRQVFNQIQQMWSAVNPNHKRSRQRKVFGALSVFILALAIVVQTPWQYWLADYRSTAGEVREIVLPDGSIAILNTNSAINVNYTENVRDVELVRGEVLVNVQGNQNDSIFRINTKYGNAAALGTRYSVQLLGNNAQVNVFESKVEVLPTISSHTSVILNAGNSVTFNSTKIGQTQVIDNDDPDWINGQLVFNDVPLIKVVERLSDYHLGHIVLSKEVADKNLRFTGVLPLDDSSAAISLLTNTLQLSSYRWTPYLVRLESK